MDDSFHYTLLRISICQILKAAGIDKCKSSVLNVLTDLYIHHFKLLIKHSIKFSDNRTSTNKIDVADITKAMIDIGFIKPSSFESYLEPDDTPRYSYIKDKHSNMHKNFNTKSMESFRDWVKYSDCFRVSRKLSEVPNELLKGLIEKRKIDSDESNELERKKRKYKERQDFYNQLKLSDLQDIDNDLFDEMADEDSVLKNDKLPWLNYLIEKDLKLGHDLKFINSELFDEFLKYQKNKKYHPTSDEEQVHAFRTSVLNLNKNDHTVVSIEENGEQVVKPPHHLIQILPYNLKYDKNLVDDNLEQYIAYANKTQQSGSDESHSSGNVDAAPVVNDEGIGGDNNLMIL